MAAAKKTAAQKATLSVEPKDGKFAVENEDGDVLLTTLTEQEAEHLKEELETEEELDDADPAGDDSEQLAQTVGAEAVSGEATTVPKSEHNPHGLDIHERFARLLLTIKKHGIHHSETAHPLQNAQTTPANYQK